MLVLRGGLVLLGFFAGHMMPGHAAADRSEDAVMDHVAGDAAHERPFEAALRLGWSRGDGRGQGQTERSSHEKCGFHDGIPLSVRARAQPRPISERARALFQRRDLGS
jgi:hypothetical protein